MPKIRQENRRTGEHENRRTGAQENRRTGTQEHRWNLETIGQVDFPNKNYYTLFVHLYLLIKIIQELR